MHNINKLKRLVNTMKLASFKEFLGKDVINEEIIHTLKVHNKVSGEITLSDNILNRFF